MVEKLAEDPSFSLTLILKVLGKFQDTGRILKAVLVYKMLK